MNRLLPALFLIPFVACDCNPPDIPDVDVGAGDGVIIIDGEDTQYAANLEASELLILVRNKADQFGCGLFHSHIVEAEGFSTSFILDTGDPEASTVNATVAAALLNPDAPELRARFDETRDQELGEGDRANIRVSVIENLNAEEFPTLTFAASGLTSLDGEGSASVEATINGASSTLTMDYTVTEADGVFTVVGTGTVDGVPHGIPSGFASDCVETDMDLFLTLVLEPGVANDGVDAGVIVPFVATEFPYDGECDPDVAFDEVREIVGPRCMGCHLNPPRLGATTPLVVYDDFRIDTARAPDAPLFETVGDYIQLPDTESVHMPPLDVTQLQTGELDTLVGWVNAGAPDVRCVPAPPAPFVHADQAACGTITFDDVSTFVSNQCGFCHGSDQDGLPVIEDHASGLNISEHPFYQPLNIWEASAIRLVDSSMPPTLFQAPDDPDIDVFIDWVAQGYPTERCDPVDAGPENDAGSDAGPDGG